MEYCDYYQVVSAVAAGMLPQVRCARKRTRSQGGANLRYARRTLRFGIVHSLRIVHSPTLRARHATLTTGAEGTLKRAGRWRVQARRLTERC